MNNNENDNIKQDKESGHGDNFEIRKETILDHIEVVLVMLL